VISFLESWLNHTISFHGGDHDIEDPEEDEESWWNCLEEFGAAELSTNSRMSPGQEDQDGAGGLDTEHRHGESQASNGNNKLFSLSLPVDGSHGPCDTNAQEDIDSVRASNISNGVICSVVLNSGGLGGESI